MSDVVVVVAIIGLVAIVAIVCRRDFRAKGLGVTLEVRDEPDKKRNR